LAKSSSEDDVDVEETPDGGLKTKLTVDSYSVVLIVIFVL